jgi:predicted nucleic acid-binding protein
LSTFVDTSALFALLDGDDENHERAARTWQTLSDRDEDLLTTNYVLVESFALFQNRLGLEAVRNLQEIFVPLFGVFWITEDIHAVAAAILLTAGKRRLSLVDCASFEAMRRSGVTRAFAFDRHFAEQGFERVP